LPKSGKFGGHEMRLSGTRLSEDGGKLNRPDSQW